MIPLEIKLDGDNAWPDLRERDDWQGGRIVALAVLEHGTTSGRPSIALRVEARDGSVVIAETTWNLLYTACRAVEGRFGPAVG